MSTVSSRGKLFLAEAKKGYIIKVLVDSLNLAMQRTTFTASREGFYHRDCNEPKHALYDVCFDRENFMSYHCESDITFSLNLNHLQKMVKNIKKKDSCILFIEKKCTDKLGIIVQSSSANTGCGRKETVYVNIFRVDNPEMPIALPEFYKPDGSEGEMVYGYPMTIESGDFQKLKKMMSVGKRVTVEMQRNNYISFYSDNGDLYSTKLEYGEIFSDDESNPEDAPAEGWYESDFHMSLFQLLMKFPGLCDAMSFHAPRVARYPLKITMMAGTLGIITVYIKDVDQIAFEDTQTRQTHIDNGTIIAPVKKGRRKKHD